MKIAPLMHVMKQSPIIDPMLVHTGQHYDDKLSKVFFDELDIPRPQINLEVGSGSREEHLTKIMAAFKPIVDAEKPDLVLVVGDVNSTLACARVAADKGIPVAHVEAGLRSFDASMPEEINRVETDKLSDFLFVTEESGITNLKQEAVKGKSFFVGNVMIDTLVKSLEKAKQSKILNDFPITPKNFAVGTFHRPSNVDTFDSLSRILRIISAICSRIPFILPLHPRTKAALNNFNLQKELESIPGLIICEPLGYLDFLNLVSESSVVITDSGGIQEETTYLKIPCLTMRENTERPITITQGSNTLVGSELSKIEQQLDNIINDSYKPSVIPEFWDGHAAQRILDIIIAELSSPTPVD